MTPDEFSDLVMGFGRGVQARPILETVRFSVGGKCFATLGWPEQEWAVVKISPSHQAWALSLGEGLAQEPGRRRKAGIVLLRLAKVDEAVAVELLAAAWAFAHRVAGPRSRAGGVATARSLSA